MSSAEVVDRRRVLSRTAMDYLTYEGREALCEGPTRAAKSWSLMFKIDYVARNYPGSRQLVCRQTRVSMNESILKDWREEILWPGHPAISKTASREGQDLYVYPLRGGTADVFFSGLECMNDDDNPLMSSKWDRIYIVQAEEIKEEVWEKLSTRLSSFKTPYHQMTADCNPSAPSHWLNERFKRKSKLGRARFRFRHYDNPLFYKGLHPDGEWTPEGKEYTTGLEETLTGVRYKRYYLGQWAASENVILDNFDPEKHVIDAELENSTSWGWLIHIKGQEQPIRVAYFTAGVDWGWHPDPGAMSVWAYDSPKWHAKIRRYRVAEVCKLKWQIDEWADLALHFAEKYGVRYFSCDRSRPELRQYIQSRLNRKKRDAPVDMVKCPPIGGGHREERDKSAQIDLMREGLGAKDGHQRTYLFRDAFPEGLDDELRRQGRPNCYESEAESWTYLRRRGSEREESIPDDKCDEHCLDAARADEVLNFARGFGRELSEEETHAPDTYGAEWARHKKNKRRKEGGYSWQ